MSKHYDDAILLAAEAEVAQYAHTEAPHEGVHKALDLVAPMIAARALREAADEAWGRTSTSPRTIAWLNNRADEIEAGR